MNAEKGLVRWSCSLGVDGAWYIVARVRGTYVQASQHIGPFYSEEEAKEVCAVRNKYEGGLL